MEYNWDYLDKKAYNNKVGQYKFRRQFKFIIDNASTHLERIFDVCGGSGRFAIPLSKYTPKITVLDLNADALQLLHERDNRIKTIQADFSKIEITDTFSLVLCIEAIGNFQNWEDFFLKIGKLLQDEGRFIFTYTNPSSWRFFLRKLKHWKNGYYPYKEMRLDELKALLKKCNFEIEKMEGMNWMPLSLASNSKLVAFFEKTERILKLYTWYSQSPWILFSVKKIV